MARPGTDALVAVRGLTIAYGLDGGGMARVVNDVSFDIAPGAALGIVGESGSGKSTLARALLGYRRAGSVFAGGAILYAGVDLVAADRAALARLRGIEIAMVPQNPLSSLTYHIRVGDQVGEVLRTRGGLTATQAKARTLELLGEMGLPRPDEIAMRYPHQLSGGQRQRVAIAAALACRPKLLVLDEPTTALDKTTEVQVLDLIARLRAERDMALALVTHDLNVVAQLCDEVVVMKDGSIVEAGPVREIFQRPRSAYTKLLLDSAAGTEPVASRTGAHSGGLLTAHGVGYGYKPAGWSFRRREGAKVLERIDFAVGRGEILGVIGESGSGKTTLGILVAGMMGPTEGNIAFDGAPLADRAAQRPAHARRAIQMIFQDPLSSLNPRRTVGASIMQPMQTFFGLDRPEARRRAVVLLEQLGMEAHFLDRYPRQLSGGQQQRIAIARAFAAEPELLICDEITSALDAAVQTQVLNSLLDLQAKTGVAMIVITHDLAVVRHVAQRVIVLQGGAIVETGAVASVFHEPKNAYTKGLLAAATRASRLATLAGPAAERRPPVVAA